MNSNLCNIAPPCGLRPHFIVAENRMREITAAMTRYAEVSKPIPAEWTKELTELSARLAENKDAAESSDPDWLAIQAGMISPDKVAPRQCGKTFSAAEEALGATFKGARESLRAKMNWLGTDGTFDKSKPDWFEQTKLAAIHHKDLYGSVRTRHMMYLGAAVQSLRELQQCSDGPERAYAFVTLLEADRAIHEATGKRLDVDRLKAADQNEDII